MSTYLTIFIETLDGYNCSLTYSGGDDDCIVDLAFLRASSELEEKTLAGRIKGGRISWVLPSIASIAGPVAAALRAVVVRV